MPDALPALVVAGATSFPLGIADAAAAAEHQGYRCLRFQANLHCAQEAGRQHDVVHAELQQECN